MKITIPLGALTALIASCPLAFSLAVEPGEAQSTVEPAMIGLDDYASLKGQSPFLRSLNLSDSLILTGFANTGTGQIATIINKETKETYVISDQPNSQGWKMVELRADPDIEKASVKVAIDNGEVVTIRHTDLKLKPGETKPAAGPSTEINGSPTAIMESKRRRNGWRGGPSPEIREKLDKLTEAQRSELFQKMHVLRQERPEMSWEERGKIFNSTLEGMTKK